jgi:hypothetical protein
MSLDEADRRLYRDKRNRRTGALVRPSRGVDGRATGSLVALQYPNGRIHDTLLTGAGLEPGDEFELYGRRWNAVALIRLPRGRESEQQRMLCLPH